MDYLIWANIYLAVFFGFYWLFLRKETFFQLNRGYLLCSILFSFILPLLDLKGYFFPTESTQFFYTMGFEAQVNQVVIPSVSAWDNWMGSISSASLIVLIYGVGCVFALIGFFYRLTLIKRNLNTFYAGQAYSFFNKVHIDRELIGYSTIVEHENIHVKQFHSFDIVLIELVKIVNWFNPVVYLLHRSIKLNHEYIADDIAAHGDNDRTGYAQILMCQALGAPIHTLANNFFNQSFTKKRIAMLFKNKSQKLVLSRFVLLIPVMLIFIAFQAKEPVLSNVQVSDIGDNASTEISHMDTGNIFTAVEVAPHPLGGMAAFIRSVTDNYVYPKEAKDANVKGRLVVTFVVEADGQLSNIKTVRDIGYGTGKEAVRVLEESEKWQPGMQNGKAVRVQYTLPILVGQGAESSKPVSPSTIQSLPVITSQSDNRLFVAVEEPPVPPGGMVSFLKYIGTNYVYPKEAEDAKVKGRIDLTFVVEKDGSISDVKSKRDLGYGTGEEAIRILKASPKWKPGVQNGKVVRVEYTLPIVLNMDSDAKY